ncbi:stage II sporulation protein E [Streptomyces sp. TLI_171]|nr:stage II sporulation protein E [Streptomyces sp. TLI_171]
MPVTGVFSRLPLPRSARGALLLSIVLAVGLGAVDVLIAVQVRTGLTPQGDRVASAGRSIGELLTVVRAADDRVEATPPASPSAVPDDLAPRARALTDEIVDDAAAVGLEADATALNSAVDTWTITATATRPVYAAADRLNADLDRHRDDLRRSAADAHNTLFVLHCTCVTVLLLLLSGVAWTMWRRIVRPLADLEEHLARTTTGTTGAALSSCRTEPWLRGVWGEAERTLLLLKESRHSAAKADEALRTDAATTYGLHRVLTAQDRPGPGVCAYGAVLAAEGVIAGDYIETLALPDGRTALLQGDVAGHGVRAGLLAAQAKSAVVAALRLGRPPGVAAAAAWSVLAQEEERFTTLVIAILDPIEQRVVWLNAGHEVVLVREAGGRVQALETTGPVIGSFVTDPEHEWQVRERAFGPGDVLVLATDGLTEARDGSGTMLGPDAVTDLLARTDPTPEDTVRALYTAVEAHGADWERDDVTVLAAALATGR